MEFAEQILQAAAVRADVAEVLAVEGETRAVYFEHNRLRSVQTKTLRGVGLRVFAAGRIGFSSTTDLRDPAAVVAAALESAQFGEPANFTLPDRAAPVDVKTFDPSVPECPAERAADAGQAAIDCALAADSRLDCSATIELGAASCRLLNTMGFDATVQGTHCGVGVEALLVAGQSFLWAFEDSSSRRLSTDLATHMQTALRWIDLARREAAVPTGRCDVIVCPCAVPDFLEGIELGTDGMAVQKGESPLAGRLGERIADERISITDDATVDFAGGSQPWDDEGVTSRPTTLVDAGVLTAFVYDLQTAERVGAATTGNATRSFSSQPSPGHTNLVMAPGAADADRMIQDVDRGLLVRQVLGAGQSNVAAGEFSVNVDLGFLIERGQIVGRAKDCMVAGNLYDVLQRVAAVSAQREWHAGWLAPTLHFHDLNVAG